MIDPTTIEEMTNLDVIKRGETRDDTVYNEADGSIDNVIDHYAMALLILTDDQWGLVREAVRGARMAKIERFLR